MLGRLMRLTVLNPRGRDPDQSFPEGPGRPEDPLHPPINFHAFAACTRGAFHSDTDVAIATGQPILVLIRRRLKRTREAVRACKSAGRRVIVSWKETGLLQVEDQLASAKAWQLFREICSEADGCLSVTRELVPLYRAAAPATPVLFLPTPYPVDFDEWDFSRPEPECSGIFVGTRRFKHPVRCHQLALAQVASLARDTGCRVSVVDGDGRGAERRIRAFGIPEAQLEIHSPRPYPDYLRLMASHRLVFQRDLGAVPGQVSGDALLCGLPCLGGNGEVDRLVHPEGAGLVGEALEARTRRLLEERSFFEAEREALRERGHSRVAFAAVRPRLEAFVERPGDGVANRAGDMKTS